MFPLQMSGIFSSGYREQQRSTQMNVDLSFLVLKKSASICVPIICDIEPSDY